MNKFTDRTCDIMAFIAAGILCLLAGLTFCDVIGRRFFDSPITGTIEMVEMGMATAAFFAMPRAFLTNSHVAAEFLEHLAKGKIGILIMLFRGILMVGMVALMAWATTHTALELMEGDRATIELELPLYPFNIIIAAAMWISAAAALVWMIRAVLAGGRQS